LWSLGVEEQFYLAWPLLMIIASRTGRHFRALSIAIAAASLAYSIWLTPHDPSAAYYLPFSRAWELMAGTIIATWRFEASTLIGEAAPAIGLAMILTATFLFQTKTPYPGYRALLPVAGTALIILAGSTRWMARVVLSRRPLVLIGL